MNNLNWHHHLLPCPVYHWAVSACLACCLHTYTTATYQRLTTCLAPTACCLPVQLPPFQMPFISRGRGADLGVGSCTTATALNTALRNAAHRARVLRLRCTALARALARTHGHAPARNISRSIIISAIPHHLYLPAPPPLPTTPPHWWFMVGGNSWCFWNTATSPPHLPPFRWRNWVPPRLRPVSPARTRYHHTHTAWLHYTVPLPHHLPYLPLPPCLPLHHLHATVRIFPPHYHLAARCYAGSRSRLRAPRILPAAAAFYNASALPAAAHCARALVRSRLPVRTPAALPRAFAKRTAPPPLPLLPAACQYLTPFCAYALPAPCAAPAHITFVTLTHAHRRACTPLHCTATARSGSTSLPLHHYACTHALLHAAPAAAPGCCPPHPPAHCPACTAPACTSHCPAARTCLPTLHCATLPALLTCSPPPLHACTATASACTLHLPAWVSTVVLGFAAPLFTPCALLRCCCFAFLPLLGCCAGSLNAAPAPAPPPALRCCWRHTHAVHGFSLLFFTALPPFCLPCLFSAHSAYRLPPRAALPTAHPFAAHLRCSNVASLLAYLLLPRTFLPLPRRTCRRGAAPSRNAFPAWLPYRAARHFSAYTARHGTLLLRAATA